MARTVTATAVKRIMTKGLTGWEAGKLVLQDLVHSYLGRDSTLSEAELAAIQHAPMQGTDVRDYNTFIALCRGFDTGYMVGNWACKDACLQIASLDRALQDADKRRTVALFESFAPHVVTREQYDDIVAAQREKKLAFEYDLAYVIEERFYATAPPEARAEIDQTAVDTESAEQFRAAVPERFADDHRQAVETIRSLHADGKLPLICHGEDTRKIKSLLTRWRKNTLSPAKTMELIDRLCVTGRALYDCPQLPEWQTFVDRYQRHWFDDDERFRHAYAVLEDGPQTWVDQNGYYKGPPRPSDWITQSTEMLLGLIGHDGKAGKSIEQVGAALRDKLDSAEQNIRMFLAVKAVLDTAADAVGLRVARDAGMLAAANMSLEAFVNLYNFRLEELKERSQLSSPSETRLEKALKMLPTIDADRLRPSPDSLKRLKAAILDNAKGHEWLRAKVRSVEYSDGFPWGELLA